MAASVLNSKRAVQASIYVVRAFVKLRQMLAPYKELMGKLDQLEKKLQTHDKQIIAIVQAIKLLMPPPERSPQPKRRFSQEKDKIKQRNVLETPYLGRVAASYSAKLVSLRSMSFAPI